MARKYESSLRAEQVERTRERILDVARALLVKEGLSGVTIPKVAAAAEVSVPTVYRYFPTHEDLLAAFLEWLRPRIGMTRERLLTGPSEDLPLLPLENFPRFEEHAAVLVPLMDSPVFNRVRVQSRPGDRRKEAAARLRAIAPKWSDKDLEAASGAVFVLASPQSWRWMRETWALDPDDAARASAWAMQTLLDAIVEERGLKPMKKKKGGKS